MSDLQNLEAVLVIAKTVATLIQMILKIISKIQEMIKDRRHLKQQDHKPSKPKAKRSHGPKSGPAPDRCAGH